MKNNRYYFIIVLRIILITINCVVLVWFYMETQKPATTLLFLLLLIFQSTSLILFLNRINRDLANFLIYLQENDTSLVFSRYRVEKNFKSIMTSLNEINSKIQEARISREEKHQYLQAVVEHLDIAIFSFNESGNIEFSNQAARGIFGLNHFNHINKLTSKYPVFEEALHNPTPDLGNIIKINSEGNIWNLTVKITQLKIGNELIHIISCLDIKPELEKQELDSWKKLIRVLRHEIMNSITPITTLTTAIRRSFTSQKQRKDCTEITPENIDDAITSAEVIEERSKGLIDFVEKFKSITDLPQPSKHLFSVKDLFEKAILLQKWKLEEKNIETKIEMSSDDLQVNADEHLLEQVIINLIKNSIEAMDHDGNITLKAFQNDTNSVCIQVIDNGKGIAAEDFENIFVPSFTTKDSGMGIGLSISRQIIQLHTGIITVKSVLGKETVFEIVLPTGSFGL
jgi:two-component system, NtrC family, nitrogen regulation sensor histidine kinase NtrY